MYYSVEALPIHIFLFFASDPKKGKTGSDSPQSLCVIVRFRPLKEITSATGSGAVNYTQPDSGTYLSVYLF